MTQSSNNNFTVQQPPVRLVVGLGNPGSKYHGTYHNVGLSFTDFLADGNSFDAPGGQKDFSFARSGEFIFVKSSVFMNNSGQAVRHALDYFNLTPRELVVVHDDSDLLLGSYKLSYESGSAGHHGIDSVISALKTQSFWRLRIGIRSENERSQAGDFVLRPVSRTHQELLQKLFDDVRSLYFEADLK